MDKRLLFSAVLVASIGANQAQAQQKVSAPILTNPLELNPETMTGTDTVYIYNVKAQKWLVNGNAYNTQTSLGDKGMKIAIVPNQTKKKNNGTFSFYNNSNSPAAGKAWDRRMFFNAIDEKGGNSYVDRASQAEWKCNWVIYPKANKTFELQPDTLSANQAQWDAGYAEIVKNARAGYNPNDDMIDGKGDAATSPIFRPALNMSAEGAAEYGIEWQAYGEADYQAYATRYALMKAINDAIDEGASIDLSKAIAVYNNASATQEEIEAATQLVSDLKRNATMAGATADNPVNITDFMKNANCDELTGWTHDCVYDTNGNVGSGGHGTNWQLQSNSTYKSEDGEYTSSKFIERWISASSNPDTDNATGTGHLSDGVLSQKLTNLAKGAYKLSCYAMATQQDKGDDYKVEGVSLFAKTSGGTEDYATVATKGGVPQKFEFMLDVQDGEDVTVGFKLDNTTANWVFVDEFQLEYYGTDANAMYLQDMQKVAQSVNDLISTAGACYTGYTEAATDVADEGMKMTTETAKADILAQKKKIQEALNTLNSSIAKYQSLEALSVEINDFMGSDGAVVTDELQALMDDCGNGTSLDDLVGSTYTLDNDGIDAYMAELTKALNQARKLSIKPGTNVTYKIVNPSFAEGSTGWEGAKSVSSSYQNCEAYQSTFDMYQDIEDIPNGVYELTAQAMARMTWNEGTQTAHENGSEVINAVLYANNLESKFASPFSYGASTKSDNEFEVTDDSGTKYIPNSMKGFQNACAESPDAYKVSVKVLVTDGKLRIGVRETARPTTDGDWAIWDNFQLTYVGNDQAAIDQVSAPVIKQAQALYDSKMNADSLQTLKTAVETVQTAGSAKTIGELAAAIEAAKTSISAYKPLGTAIENAQTRYESNEATAKTSDAAKAIYNAALATAESAYNDGSVADAEVPAAIKALNAGFTKYVINDVVSKATKENPVDISKAIVNNDFATMDKTGWTVKDGSFGFQASNNVEAGEFYNCSFNLQQELVGLPAGTYYLKAKAFYRNGNDATAFVDEEETTKKYEINENAFVYFSYNEDVISEVTDDEGKKSNVINEDVLKQPLAPIAVAPVAAINMNEYLKLGSTDGCTKYVEDENDENQNLWIPNNMVTAQAFFNSEQVGSKFESEPVKIVYDGKSNFYIGACKTVKVSNDWTIIKDFTLQYAGSDGTETGINGINGEATGNVIGTKIYNAAGVQTGKLQKGINIVETILSDGSKKVSKIIVK